MFKHLMKPVKTHSEFTTILPFNSRKILTEMCSCLVYCRQLLFSDPVISHLVIVSLKKKERNISIDITDSGAFLSNSHLGKNVIVKQRCFIENRQTEINTICLFLFFGPKLYHSTLIQFILQARWDLLTKVI